MALPASSAAADDRNLYPIHEEDDLPEIAFHERVARYLRDALSAHNPEWFVTGNVCIYWEPGNFDAYCAPDVFVARERLAEPYPRVYQLWRDPPVDFVAEVGSQRTAQEEESMRLARFQNVLRVPVHLYFDLETLELRLRRLGPGGYELVEPGANGRLASEQLDLEFALDEEGFPRVYTREGERLLTHEEAVARRREAEARAAEEAQARTSEAERRRQAEARAAAEARQRQEAEARAAEERSRREELEREIAALRAQLEPRDPSA